MAVTKALAGVCFRIAELALLFTVTGCATMVGQSEYQVDFDTEPSGARIVVTDRYGALMYKGGTPVTLTLNSSVSYFRRAWYEVKASKDGFEPGKGLLTARVDPYYYGNIFFGGLIGMLIVDPASGAMFRLPGWITVQLSPINMSSVEDAEP